ncbi:MAG: tetratricopeptide repeat protein [Rubrivivax sp.]|nr:tetratricopeptide repeat protein [Rubrivivax sp.]
MVQRTLLFSDIVDSTKVVQQLGDERAALLWSRLDQRTRALLARHGGLEVDRSDGCFVLFDEAGPAVAFALEYHDAVAELGLAARVGVHVGDVLLRRPAARSPEAGSRPVEVDGLAKPVAARIMSLARGGQTLLSETAAAAVRQARTPGLRLQPHGHYRLKGVDEPVAIHEIASEHGNFAPPADTEKAYRVVGDGDLWAPAREIRHNLPLELDAFIGRGVELAALARRLSGGVRLLTLLGTGGTGKTRFACRYARAWLGEWPGGVSFCDLSEARDVDGICFVVGTALEVPPGHEDPVTRLGHAIAGRGRCLVVLDNFEQVAAQAAATLGRWLQRAPEATFVVTSRELLHLPGEEVCTVEPLRVDTEAVDLFVARARSRLPGFPVDEDVRAEIREVVQLLDGLPLAIELAAARVTVLSLAQIRARLKDRFGLLAGARGVSARRQTLRAAIDWSWSLLMPWEQSALAQCAVFEGGFTLAAAEAVLDLHALPDAPPVIDVVQSLVDKSLLRTWRPPVRHDLAEPYFGMYLSLHDYAADRLAAMGLSEARAAMERHGRHYAEYGTDARIEGLSMHGGVERRQALAFETDNLMAACRRAAARGDAETAALALAAAWQVLQLRGPFGVVIGLAAGLLDMEGLRPPARVGVLCIQGDASRNLGRSAEAADPLWAALAEARSAGDRRGQAAACLRLGILASDGGENERAQRLCEEAQVLGADLGDRLLVAQALRERGIIAYDAGRMDEARQHYVASLELRREIGDRRGEADVLNNLGVHHASQGRIQDAVVCFEQALQIHRALGDRRGEGQALGNLGSTAIETGAYELAAEHFDQALRIHRDLGSRRLEGVTLGNLSYTRFEQGRIDEAHELVQSALGIHAEVGNRRSEAFALHQAAAIHTSRGRHAEATSCIDRALAIARETGTRGVEGWLLRIQGDMLLERGDPQAARAVWQLAETALRDVGDLIELAKLQCSIAHLHQRDGDPASARLALAEAVAIAGSARLDDQSEVGRLISGLRRDLETPDIPCPPPNAS